MFYAAWITSLILICGVTAWLSQLSNQNPSSWRCFLWLYLCNTVSVWPLVARYSKHLLFDALLYDVIMFFVYYGVLIGMGTNRTLTPLQWIAMSLVATGMLLMKLG